MNRLSPPKLTGVLVLLAAACLLVGGPPASGAGPSTRQEPRELPRFPEHAGKYWINTEPLTVEGLRGKVVLLKVWTFG